MPAKPIAKAAVKLGLSTLGKVATIGGIALGGFLAIKFGRGIYNGYKKAKEEQAKQE